MIIFRKLRFKNFLSTSNSFTEILLDKSSSTLVLGKNGAGKCLMGNTEVDIEFLDDDTRKKYEEFLKRS